MNLNLMLIYIYIYIYDKLYRPRTIYATFPTAFHLESAISGFTFARISAAVVKVVLGPFKLTSK